MFRVLVRTLVSIGLLLPGLVAAAEPDKVAPSKRISLKVTVVDEAGQPAAGVAVSAHASLNFPSMVAETDVNGHATFELDPKQASGLTVWADDGTQMGQGQLPWSQEPPDTLPPVTIELAAAPRDGRTGGGRIG